MVTAVLPIHWESASLQKETDNHGNSQMEIKREWIYITMHFAWRACSLVCWEIGFCFVTKTGGTLWLYIITLDLVCPAQGKRKFLKEWICLFVKRISLRIFTHKAANKFDMALWPTLGCLCVCVCKAARRLLPCFITTTITWSSALADMSPV